MDYDNATDHLDTTEYDEMVEYFGTPPTPTDQVMEEWDEYGYLYTDLIIDFGY